MGDPGLDSPSYLIYRYKLEFDQDVLMNSVRVGGVGDNSGPNSFLRLLDESISVIATTPLIGGAESVYHTHTVDAGGLLGRVFYLDEFDRSTDFRYRDMIHVSYTAVPEPVVIPGDANLDMRFDSDDIIAVLGAGKYQTGLASAWADGDWDGAPDLAFTYETGPPSGNGLFDTNDIISALGTGYFELGPIAAATPEPSALVLAAIGCLVLGTSRWRTSLDLR